MFKKKRSPFSFLKNKNTLPTERKSGNQKLNEEEKRFLKMDLGIPFEAKVVLSFCIEAQQYLIADVLRNFSEIVIKEANVFLLLFVDHKIQEEIDMFIKQLDIEEKVRCVTPFAMTDMNKYYQISDVFLGSLSHRNQTDAFLEAMEQQLPLVCKADPLLEEYIIEGFNGYQYHNGEELVRYICEVLKNEVWRKSAQFFNEYVATNQEQNKNQVKIILAAK